MSDTNALRDLIDYGFDSRRALEEVIRSSSYRTTAQAIAALTKFSHPSTVAQTNNCNIFRTIRWTSGEVDNEGKVIKRGHYSDHGDNNRVMLDDNHSPTNAFVWANGSALKACKDVQFNHVWFGAKDVRLYTSLANLCVTPAFLAKLTDTDKEICPLLRYRAYELYDGFKPCNQTVPPKPKGYDDLSWASTLPEMHNVEASMRSAIQATRNNRTVRSIQAIGWYFSEFSPEPEIKTNN